MARKFVLSELQYSVNAVLYNKVELVHLAVFLVRLIWEAETDALTSTIIWPLLFFAISIYVIAFLSAEFVYDWWNVNLISQPASQPTDL